MAHISADRVRDTTTTTGTGSVTVSGTAPSGFRTFSAVMAVSDTCFYSIQHQTANEWETGLGTYSSANVIARTTVLSSSNSGGAVNFSAGGKDVFITLAAGKTIQQDASGNVGISAASDIRTAPTTLTIAKTSSAYLGVDIGSQILLKSSNQSGAQKNIAALTTSIYDDGTTDNSNSLLIDVACGANTLDPADPGNSWFLTSLDTGGGSRSVTGSYSWAGTVGAGGGLQFVNFGGTRSSTTAVGDGYNLGYISSFGWNGSGYGEFAGISSYADGVVSETSCPGRYVFFTTSANAVTATEKMRLDSAGNLLIGTPTAGSKLTVAGQINGAYNDTTSNASETAMALGTNTLAKVLVAANKTLTTTVPAAGARATVIIQTSGSTTRTVTFGTGFKPQGTLATGGTANRYWVVEFISDGTSLFETSRTTTAYA